MIIAVLGTMRYTVSMKRFFLFLGIFLLMFFAPPTFAQGRYASCDLCGFCITPNPTPNALPTADTPPGNWESCRNCLYPDLLGVPASSLATLQINPSGVTTHAKGGHYYTMLGCISTNMNDFTNPTAAGSVTQKLLDTIFSIAGAIAFLYLIYGAFLILTSQSDPERLNHGKRTVYGAIIGVVFVIISVFIVNILATNVLKLPGFGGGLRKLFLATKIDTRGK